MDPEKPVFENRHDYWKNLHALRSQENEVCTGNRSDEQDNNMRFCYNTINFKQKQQDISQHLTHCSQCRGTNLMDVPDKDNYILGKTCMKCNEFMGIVDDSVSIHEVEDALKSIEAMICDQCYNTDIYKYEIQLTGEGRYCIHCVDCGANMPINHTGIELKNDMPTQDFKNLQIKGGGKGDLEKESHEYQIETTGTTQTIHKDQQGWLEWSKSVVQRLIFGKVRKQDFTEKDRAAKRNIKDATDLVAAWIPSDCFENLGFNPNLVPNARVMKVIKIAGLQIYEAMKSNTNPEEEKSEITKDNFAIEVEDTEATVAAGINDDQCDQNNVDEVSVASRQNEGDTSVTAPGQKRVEHRGKTKGHQGTNNTRSPMGRVASFGFSMGVAYLPFVCQYAGGSAAAAAVGPIAPYLVFPVSTVGEMVGQNLGDAMANYLVQKKGGEKH